MFSANPHTPALAWSDSPEQRWRFRFFLLLGISAVFVVGGAIPLLDVPDRPVDVYAATSQPVEVQWLPSRQPAPLKAMRLDVAEAVELAPVVAVEEKAPPETSEVTPEPAPKDRPLAKETPTRATDSAAARTVNSGAKAATSAATAKARAQNRFDDIFGGGLAGSIHGKGARSVENEQLMAAATAHSSSAGAPEGVGAYSRSRGTSVPVRESSKLDKVKADPIRSTLSDSVTVEKSQRKQGGQRSRASVQVVFDRNKRRFDRLYSRALRQQAGLSGEVVFSLTIEASGKVSRVSVARSALGQAELERKLLAAVRQLDFGPESGVSAMTLQYPIQFYPS